MPLSTTTPSLVETIESKLREEEWLIDEWSPIFLRNMLNRWFFKEGVNEVSALKVWQDSCQYLFLPRLINDQVFKNAMNAGVASKDYFGYASGKEGDKYLGFVFDSNGFVSLDAESLLIERETAQQYRAKLEAEARARADAEKQHAESATRSEDAQDDSATTGGESKATAYGDAGQTSATSSTVNKQFFGSVNLDPVKAKMDFATVVDEIVEQFNLRSGVKVNISVEIEAESLDGFDESLQRTIKENCNTLKFKNSDFEA